MCHNTYMSLTSKFLKIFRTVDEKISDRVISFHTRPLLSSEYRLTSHPRTSPEKIGVVIQGPLLLKKDFTLETVKLYKKTFSSDTIIIVSTWEGEDPVTIQKIQDLGVTVLINQKPKKSGISHINFQIVSSLTGINEAKTHGADYVLKTRTDQRMYATDVEEFLLSTIHTFPSLSQYSQQKRIIAVGLNTYTYRPYSISDMTLFGTTSDMQLYFDAPHDTRDHFSFQGLSLRNWSKGKFSEGLLVINFLEKIGRKVTFTLEDSWRVYADHFCIIDTQSLGIFWYKYEYWNEYRATDYSTMKNNQELTYKDWLTLYARFPKKETIPEYIIDSEFAEKIKPTH